MADYGTGLRDRLAMGSYRDYRAGYRNTFMQGGDAGYDRTFSGRMWRSGYDLDINAGRGQWGTSGPFPGQGARRGPSSRGRARGYDLEMLSNEDSRRLRGGWERGYDLGYRAPNRYLGYDRDYLQNRASSSYEQDYMRPGPTYGLRDSTFSPRGYGR